MNKERLQSALNYIGDDLIAEAADYRPKAARVKPGSVIKFAGAFACAAAVLAGAVWLKLWYDTKFDGVSISNTPNDNISAIISAIIPANAGDSSPGTRFSPVYGKGDPTLDDMKKFSSVIWYDEGKALIDDKKDSDSVKSDDEFSRDVKPGTVEMSELLYELITKDFDNSPLFAVRVYDCCQKEYEIDHWRYKGRTIQEIKTESQVAAVEVDPADKGTANELAALLDDAYYDYYLVQMQRFYDDIFKPLNREIYPIEKGSTIKGYNWFYCFMTAQEIAALACGPDEAFFLDLAYKNTN